MTQQGDNRHDGNTYVLTLGLPPLPAPLTLGSGVSLRPLGKPLTVFDLAAAGAAGFHGWGVLGPVAEACTCEIESARDAEAIPGYDVLNRAWLASALMVLRGFTQHMCVACSSYSWSIVAGHQERTKHVFQQQLEDEGVNKAVFASRRDLPPFSGNLLDFHLHVLGIEDRRTDAVDNNDARWIRGHFETFNRLAAESESFRFALEACVDWRFAKDIRSAVARLWGGIEATFGISSELVHRISLLSASLLEPRGQRRKERFEHFKRLYGLRSKAVHGEPLSPEKMSLALNQSYGLLRDLLLLSIEREHVLGKADFDDAVFC